MGTGTSLLEVSRRFLPVLVLLSCLPFSPAMPAEGIRLPDGSVYHGALQAGRFTGMGRLEWANGRRYEGSFRDGLMAGRGTMNFANGDVYVGEFRQGMMHGQGILSFINGDRYEGEMARDMLNGYGVFYGASGNTYIGDFVDDRAQGAMRIEYANGDIYDGEVASWRPHGKGLLVTVRGASYAGTFVNGELEGRASMKEPDGRFYEGEVRAWRYHGRGRLVLPDGGVYEGEFVDGRYHGQGVFTYRNGDRYEGQFADGLYHGEGVFIYKQPRGRKKRLVGRWKWGRYERTDLKKDSDRPVPKLVAETLLYGEAARLEKRLGKITAGRPGIIDMYFLAFAGYGGQDVFMKEAVFSRELFRSHFGAAGRSLALINNPALAGRHPLASVTNLDRSLEAIAAKMNREEDILFLFLTSHGAPSHVLDVSLQGVPLQDLRPVQLGKLLEKHGIRWKVVVVSACYSGGFIEALADETTLVMSSAAADHTSFGCSDEAEFTFFGRAFFKESLTTTDSFQEAFERARVLVAEREKQEGYDHSRPQIHVGARIAARLQQWRAQTVAPLAASE